ncbi:MAG: hypothetical protein RIC95_08515 [Vicingaceae bacterium]
MSKIFKYSLLGVLLFTAFVSKAQLSDKEKLTEALYLVDEKRFMAAYDTLIQLYEQDKYKSNANVNFNIGISILNSFNREEKAKAIPYLKIAAQDVDPNYTPFSPREKKAPVDAWYYLGKAQHLDYQFSDAEESFNKFETYINENHYLWNAVEREKSMCHFAKKAMQNPVKVKTKNLGGKINGFYPDFSPVITIDESTIYFTSRRLREDSSNYEIYDPQDGMMFEDIYVSYFVDNEWQEPAPLNINTPGHEATVNLSIDGQTLFIYKDINGNGELYKSTFEYDSSGYEIWSEPEKLGSDINSDAYETHVTISPDGKMLYFVSDRDGGLGGKDIYYCRMLPTGKWALSQNAGAVLNSKFDEDGVFMHPDGKTMYFSSNGHQSIGGYDFMYSTLTDSGWTEPTNLGYPINSVDDDVFLVTSPDGKRAYFSSFKEDGYGEKDIYMLELIEAEEKALTLYRGEFTFIDRRVPPAGAAVTITDNETGRLVGSYTPRARDGQFSAILEPNKSYHFMYEAAAYETYEEDIYVPANANYQEIYKEIKLKPVRVGKGLGKISPAPLALANITGGIKQAGKPLDSIKILLLNEQEDLLQKTETDDVGVFDFAKLDPTKTYLIRVITNKDNPITDYEIDLKNDKGEVLTFERLDDSTHIFVPSLFPNEYYKLGEEKIAGVVKKDNNPLAGLNVRLEDEEQETLREETTDEVGEFNFEKLDLDKKYRIIFEGDFPEDPEILLTNQEGEELSFKKVEEGVYVYTPKAYPAGTPVAALSDIEGAVTDENEYPIIGLKVLLLSYEQDLLNSASTDSLGKFNFMDLNLNKTYYIQFEGDYPEDLKLVVANEDFELMPFRKIGEGLYIYEPLYNVRLVNVNNNDLLQEETTDKVEEFNYQKLEADQTYRIIYEADYPDQSEIVIVNTEGKEFKFKRVDEGVFEYRPLPFDGLRSYTLNVEAEEDFQETYPRPEELKGVIAYFQRYFIYNAKDISKQNEKFVAFINDIAKLVEYRGYADIMITSSASKVPTKTWKTNSILTKRRAYDTKRLLETIFKEKGIKEDQYNFVDINTLITGPEYKGDYDTNRSTYEKYQYVRIFVK